MSSGHVLHNFLSSNQASLKRKPNGYLKWAGKVLQRLTRKTLGLTELCFNIKLQF